MQWVNILGALGNQLLKSIGKLPKSKQDIANRRLSICSKCSIRTKNKCDSTKHENGIYGCGCPLDRKVLSMDTSCPLNKW